MLRLNLLLALALVACALAVVSARHKARELFVALQKEQAAGRALDIEWGRLLLEQSTWAMHTRIEGVAGKQLQMLVPEPQQIHLLKRPERSAP